MERLAVQHRAFHDCIDGRDLRGRQTAILLAAFALERLRFETAGAWIVHDPVLQTIERIALVHHRLREDVARGFVEHGRLNLLRIRIHLLRDGGERCGDALEVDGGRAGDDAVEIIGIALRHLKRLTPAIRAAGEVSALGWAAIAGDQQRLGGLARAVDRGVRVVRDPLIVA